MHERSSSSSLKIGDFWKKKNVKPWPKAGSKWKEATNLMAEWCVRESRPLRIVEDNGFRKFLSSICP